MNAILPILLRTIFMKKSSRPDKATKPATKRITAWWTHAGKMRWILFGAAFLLYANSLRNGFVLDDSLVIVNNQFTKAGISGIADIFSHDTFKGYYGDNFEEIKVTGGRYRPLSVAFFAVIYQIAGANPFLFHFWNVLLYACCCALLYIVLRHILDPRNDYATGALLALLASAIFVFHPIHTEVVNNIKSNDEIMCLLFSLGALFFAMRYVDTGQVKSAILSAAAFFLGCLAKENAIVFLAIIPLSIYIRNGILSKKSFGGAPLWIGLAMTAVIYIAVRTAVIGWSMGAAPLDLINNPFIKWTGDQWGHCTFSEKMAMVFYALGKYIQLLVAPFTLSTDYYPRAVNVMNFSNPVALISLLAHLAMAGWAIIRLLKRKRGIIMYGVLFYLIALSIVSNIVFPIGTNLAERFLFTPSIGFCLVIGCIAAHHMLHGAPLIKQIVPWVMVGLLGFYAVRTFIRNYDFESNTVLFNKDVKASPNSAKVTFALGSIKAEEAARTSIQSERDTLVQQAIKLINTALHIHPTYLEAYYMRGNIHFMAGQYEAAVADYQKSLSLNPNFKPAFGNYALSLREYAKQILQSGGDRARAIALLEESLKMYPDEAETQRLLTEARSGMQ